MAGGPKLGFTGFSIFDEKLMGFYRATVLDVPDPLQLGRIKAEVIPYFVGIDKDIIPWATPAMPLTSGSGTGTGSFAVPNTHSKVWVFFEMGDIYQPVYFAEATDGVHGIPAFSAGADYPNVRGFQTSSGVIFYIDDTTNNVYVKLSHPSGTYYTIDDSGNITLFSADQITLQADNAITIENSNANITVTPDNTHQAVIKNFSHIVKSLNGGSVTPEYGGVINFSGAVTFTMPNPGLYPGLEFLFVRSDGGITPAVVTNQVSTLGYINITGQWATARVTDCGSRWVVG